MFAFNVSITSKAEALLISRKDEATMLLQPRKRALAELPESEVALLQ